MRFALVINVKAAKALGLTAPRIVLRLRPPVARAV